MPGYAGWTEWSAQAELMGYMEGQTIYNAINFSFCGGFDYGAQCNSTGWNTLVKTFICPSDNNAATASPNGAGTLPNTNSYRGSIGTTTLAGWSDVKTPGYASCQPDPFNIRGGQPGCQAYSTGAFAYWVAYGLRDLTDGSSNTIVFSESLVGDQTSSRTRRNNSVTGLPGGGGTNNYYNPAEVPDASAIPFTTLTQYLQACTTAYQTGPATNISNANGNRWGWGAMAMTLFNTIVPPNSTQYPWNSCKVDCPTCSPDDSQFSNAQSNHPGGINVLFGDGSVRFVKDSVNQQTWFALGTRSNGEVLSSDSY